MDTQSKTITDLSMWLHRHAGLGGCTFVHRFPEAHELGSQVIPERPDDADLEQIEQAIAATVEPRRFDLGGQMIETAARLANFALVWHDGALRLHVAEEHTRPDGSTFGRAREDVTLPGPLQEQLQAWADHLHALHRAQYGLPERADRPHLARDFPAGKPALALAPPPPAAAPSPPEENS